MSARDARRDDPAAHDARVGAAATGRCGAPKLESGGVRSQVRARAIVNAAGPWVKDVLDRLHDDPGTASVRHVKGSHIVVPRVHPEEHAYILQNADKRIVFVIPYQQKYSLIGTTDITVEQLRRSADSDDEIDYLLQLVNAYLATPLRAGRHRMDATAACARSTTTARPIRRR